MKSQWTTLILALLAGFVSQGDSCSSSVTSDECRELSNRITAEVDRLAEAHRGCDIDSDCTFVTVVLPCWRENARVLPLAKAEYEAYRGEIQALSSTLCNTENTDDCNAHCSSPTGSLVFNLIGTACSDGSCAAVEGPEGLADPEEGGSLSSQELCNPTKFVYLPEDI